ncbi:AMP-binding protein [Niveibacterium sp. 24ML]|uniref:phenylacetate--CoA ligase family protein n=1 Tax=Niveibacterium sp. 24ML TaxID=2985512 RepID=UPI00226DB7B6|nr:AMP-binding protein [Niveibacterium sp. 24ML]MCX9157380.1 AMP-binding protein [Niveibacterium sp. 24ML]
MPHHYDALETRHPADREAALMARLPAHVARAQAMAPAFAERLRGIDAAAVRSRAALARLPVLRKADLLARQRDEPPFGGYATAAWGPEMARVFVSPGPISEPEAARRDYWRMARALHAAGLRRGMLVHNAFSYHFTPAGSMLESGAHAIGCSVFPAGVGQTEMQVQAIASLRPHAYVGTPSFLRILLEKADEMGLDCGSLRHAVVSGEAFPAATRQALIERGIASHQVYATADIGAIAYETPAHDGLVVEEHAIVEIVEPGGDTLMPEGEVGEVVVTTFNPTYPLIRFGTGDLSRVLPGLSPCGRTNTRLAGWLGRADQTTKVRGMFVHPGQITALARRFPELARVRLVVDNPNGYDHMHLQCEVTQHDAGVAEQLAHALRDLTRLRAEVSMVAPGTLADDGRVIEDRRRYD